ncbi:MAG: hypothetical protein AAF699_11865 [Pseudomonadota bacterium]
MEKKKTLEELVNALNPYALYQIVISIPTGTTAMRVEIYTRTEEDRDKAIAILEDYRHLIVHYWVYVSFTDDDAVKKINELKIGSYKAALRKYILSAVNYIKATQQEALYAFAICVFTDSYSISLHWNTESAFNEELKRRQKRSSHYSSPASIENMKYHSVSFASDEAYIKIDGYDEISRITQRHSDLLDQVMENNGVKAMHVLGRMYQGLMNNATIAVMNELADEIKSLSDSDDFVFYLQFLDDADFDQFNVLQQTVPEDKIRRLMGNAFKDYLC